MSARSSAAISLAVAVCACSHAGDQARKGEPLRVAAASDLSIAFGDVGAAYEQSTGKKVTFTFGSTGLLAKQIKEGAPFDLLAAADESYVDDVVRSGSCLGDTKRAYARGRLVVWSADPSRLPTKIQELADPRYAKIAIANPDHAPYGRAALQALQAAGVWQATKPRTVFGENVQQALQYAQSGNADVSIVALSIAMTSGGGYVAIDPALHAPLDQAMVVCAAGAGRGKPNEARAFEDFVASDAGRAIMRRYGFLLPGDSLPPR